MEQELEMVRAPGFRFYPTEEELITFYLKHKIQYSACKNRLLQDHIHRVIPQLHVYDFYPWDLPQYAGEVCRGDQEQWFFFIPRQEKELQGSRPSRLTSCGYWKGTGSPSVVYSSSSPNNQAIGIKRSMVFYKGKAPTGNKTKWKMNEYKAFHQQQQQQSSLTSNTNLKPKLMQEASLCRVYIKSNCARAFDRRPSGSVTRDHRLLGPARHTFNENQATTSTHFNSRSITKSTTSTFDYNSNSLEVFEDQALWNWEENH